MKLYKIICLLSTLFLLNILFFETEIKAQVLTKQITNHRANITKVNDDGSNLGSKERWEYTGDINDFEKRFSDYRKAGTVLSPRGWKYKGGTTTTTNIPLTVNYSEDGYTGVLSLDTTTAPYFGWDREDVQGYNGLDNNGGTEEYTFTQNHPVPGQPGQFYNGSTLTDIGVYSGTVTKIIPSKPVAKITAPNFVLVGTTVPVIGSGIDPLGLAITDYEWTSSNGQSLTNTGGNIKVDSVVILTLKVKNSDDVWSDVVTHTINVTKPTSKPIAQINAPNSVHIGTTVVVQGSGIDPMGLAITDYVWTSSNGQTLTGTGGNIKVDFNVNLTLKVKNSDNVWSDPATHTISIENKPPTVSIIVPPTVYSGDDIYISGYAQDKDGDPLVYLWNKPSNMYGILEGQGGTVYFMDLGNKQFGLTATDPFGESAYTSATTNVIAPTPIINIVQTGTLKENRKITIDTSSSSGGSKRATITSIKYNVTSLYGTSINDVRIQSHTLGSTNGTILYDPSKGIDKSLDGLNIFDITFKKSGQYKIDCTMTNNFGKTSTNTMTLTIAIDAPPKAGLTMPDKILRDHFDPNKFNGLAYSIIPFTDTESGEHGCYSIDGDTIEKRGWFYSFDSNNNDIIDDPWYPYNAATNKWDYSVKYTYEQAKNFDLDKFPVGNLLTVTLETAHVGVYYSGIICKESFGQEYIPQFINDADRKVGNGFD